MAHTSAAWRAEAKSPALAVSLIACLSAGVLNLTHPWWALDILLALISFLFVAAFFPAWHIFNVPLVTAGMRGHHGISLTFDDGPDPVLTPLLLGLLAAHEVKATFFVIGEKARKHPELIEAIAAGGHEIGNHTWSHDYFLNLRPAGALKREINTCHELLLAAGVPCRFFRPPFGVVSPRLGPVLRASGLTCVAFSRRGADGGNRRIDGLALRLLEKIAAGQIVLLHDARPYPQFDTTKWLGEIASIIEGARERGLNILPLAAFVGLPATWRSLNWESYRTAS